MSLRSKHDSQSSYISCYLIDLRFYLPVFQLDFAQVIHFNHLSRRKSETSAHGCQECLEETVGALLIILNSYLESLICGIKQQFNPILSQVQYEVMAEWCLQRQGVKTDKLTLRGRSRCCHAQANGP